ncbi:hypothetical protein ABEB36_001720 [Hypothenemus hampei]|uniref:Uncharacterized protein n=1 Tax=Hypothenemus hampei TaxID=57062 RepID=A0ABD1FI30_HYPHA
MLNYKSFNTDLVTMAEDSNRQKATLLSNYQPLYQVVDGSSARHCNNCHSCLQLQNVYVHPSETMPLLGNRVRPCNDRFLDKMIFVSCVLLLFFGSATAGYLLFSETRDVIMEEFDYVSRDNWLGNDSISESWQSLRTPVSKILLYELTTNCTDPVDPGHCLFYTEYTENSKPKMKIMNDELRFNFYEDKNGKIFEGRGVKFQSECGRPEGCQDILTIAMLGNGDQAPSDQQVAKLNAFLDYAVTDNALLPCYEILVSHQLTRAFDDVAEKLTTLNRGNGVCKYYFS